jgi:hypothetical protein
MDYGVGSDTRACKRRFGKMMAEGLEALWGNLREMQQAPSGRRL